MVVSWCCFNKRCCNFLITSGCTTSQRPSLSGEIAPPHDDPTAHHAGSIFDQQAEKNFGNSCFIPSGDMKKKRDLWFDIGSFSQSTVRFSKSTNLFPTPPHRCFLLPLIGATVLLLSLSRLPSTEPFLLWNIHEWMHSRIRIHCQIVSTGGRLHHVEFAEDKANIPLLFKWSRYLRFSTHLRMLLFVVRLPCNLESCDVPLFPLTRWILGFFLPDKAKRQ